MVLNARAAADHGAEIATRTRVSRVNEEAGFWRVILEADGQQREVRARGLVNAAGPWVDTVASLARGDGEAPARPRLRLVKGSHIVVPRIAGAEDACLFQNSDGRVVFALPFAERFTLIGTTDMPYSGDPADAAISPEETAYLIGVANRYFRQPIAASNIVWTFAGVRPLYDDAAGNPSAITRDYRLEVAASPGRAPLLTVLGGKITTYRRLAEQAMEQLAPFFPRMGRAWTATSPLPGGVMGETGFEPWLADLVRRRAGIPPAFLTRLARRHGSLTDTVLGSASFACRSRDDHRR